jgi:hypothetical protein
MNHKYSTLAGTVLCILGCVLLVNEAVPLTVAKISLQELTAQSNLVIYGTIVSAHSRWEGQAINTYTSIRVKETLKGEGREFITVKQMGGRVGDISDEVTGSPELKEGEDVILFLVEWKGSYWIHSIVLGKFSIVTQNGSLVACNDLNNVGLIDPVTKREVTDPTKKTNAFPLGSFMNEIRSQSSK